MTFCELILKQFASRRAARILPSCRRAWDINALNRTELNTTARAVNSDDHSRSGARALPELPLRAKMLAAAFSRWSARRVREGLATGIPLDVAKFATHRVFADWPGLGTK